MASRAGESLRRRAREHRVPDHREVERLAASLSVERDQRVVLRFLHGGVVARYGEQAAQKAACRRDPPRLVLHLDDVVDVRLLLPLERDRRLARVLRDEEVVVGEIERGAGRRPGDAVARDRASA
jgi:hypothetical protein